ncbi:MAG: hypothetical protein ICV63_18290 [Coleofasciculus sp. Co-bin14]|nr:hypothetical protein [Coleofasciculus sp. Co-bin14]
MERFNLLGCWANLTQCELLLALNLLLIILGSKTCMVSHAFQSYEFDEKSWQTKKCKLQALNDRE